MLLSARPGLTAGDRATLDAKAASARQHNALADKAVAEVEAMRASEAARRDPRLRLEHATMTSGLTMPVAEQLQRSIRGEQVPLAIAGDDEGNAMPPAEYARPEAVTHEQERMFRSTIAAQIANQLATGKTNADQLAHAGARTNEAIVRNEATALLDNDLQNTKVAPYRATAYEPYSAANAQGVSTNKVTGKATVAQPDIYQAAVQAIQEQARQRGTAADVNAVRATQVLPAQAAQATTAAQANRSRAGESVARSIHLGERTETERVTRQPRVDLLNSRAGESAARIPEIEARADQRRATTEDIEERTTGRRETRESKGALAAQGTARTNFRADAARDPKLKGAKLGRWVQGQGFEVIKDNRVVGYYD